jgi:hypothetical protein
MKDDKLEKAIVLLKKYFEETPQEEIDALIDQVDSMKFDGPTLKQYKRLLKKHGIWNS